MSLTDHMGLAVRSLTAPLVMATRWWGGEENAGDGVPETAFSLARLARSALDEIFFAAELVSSRLISPADRRRLRSELWEALHLFQEAGWLRDPASYHPRPPALPNPDLQSDESHGLRFTHLSFASGYQPHPGEPGRERWLGYEANRTAHAWVLQHPGRPRPWLMCIHGYRMGTPWTDLVAFRALWLHHKRGLNVILPVLPLHGPRTAGARTGDGFLTGDFLDTLHLQAQAMWDLRRLLAWVRTQGNPPVGVYGLSLGGYTAALLTTLEPGLSCAIAGIPASDFVRLALAHIPRAVAWMAEFAGLDWDDITKLMRVVSPLALPPLLPRERRYIFAGLADRLVPPSHVASLWRHWGRPEILWYEGGHVAFRWNRQVKHLLRHALADSGLTEDACLEIEAQAAIA